MEFEHQFLLFIQNNIRQEWLTPIMTFITSLGNAGWFFIVIALILLLMPKTRKYGICMAIALILHLLIVNFGLKPLVGRMRPYDRYQDILLLVKPETDASFPSGHTAASLAASLALFQILPKGQKKWGVLLLILSGLIAISRLYVGVHYPTDVLGGILAGIACAELAVYLCRKWIWEWVDRKMPGRKNNI